jgi:general secretion pathway protein I
MVALLIMGVALPALLFQVMSTVDGTYALRNQAVAQWVAENKLAQLRLQKLTTGQVLNGNLNGETEMANATWQWNVDISNTDVDTFRRVDIHVGFPEQDALISLVAFIND